MMAKKQSTFKNMLFSLLIITIVSAVSLAYINHLTKGPRSDAHTNKQKKALMQVLPEFDTLDEPISVSTNDDGEEIWVFKAYKNKQWVGTAVEAYSLKGYGGKVSILVGFSPNGNIYNTSVLSHSETPGFGDKMDASKSDFPNQFNEKNPGKFKINLKKNGGDVDAITGATISSIAFCEAVKQACLAFENKSEEKPEEITIQEVLPPATSVSEITTEKDKGFKVFQATGENNEILAFGVESYSEIGFNGKMVVLIGFLPNGEIYNTKVLKHNETSGYGDMIEEEKSDFVKQFKGNNPATYKLAPKQSGGDIDVFSGATITTEGYCDCIMKAYELLKTKKLLQ